MSANIGLLTHGTAAVAYLLLLILLLARGLVRPLGPGLLFAIGATSAWAALVAAGTLFPYPPVTLMPPTDIIDWIIKKKAE